MCGIAGIAGKTSSPQEELVEKMLRIMRHRGPDAHNLFLSHKITLGHCRLAINDLSDAATQPFVSDNNETVVSVNGEIYNFKELRKDLETRGAYFKSNSDSEVILHGYQQYGLDIITMLNGMFAIAIYDKYLNTLFLARDRLGIKPLYYSSNVNFFIFGSEIKSIAQCKEVDLALDYQSFSEYLIFENYFSNRTLNHNIKIVEPGEIVEIPLDSLKTSRKKYWTPQFSSNKSDLNSIYDQYLSTIEDSVRRHLLSDVPVGAYLSSGVDSSSVVYWASQNLQGELKTFTGNFGMTGFYDESVPAATIADELDSDHKLVQICPDDFVKNIETVLWHLDEPRVGMGSFSQYMVAKNAAKDVRVILTGHGGDEFFAGYPVFKAIYGKHHFFKLLKNSSIRELMFAAYFLFGPMLQSEIGYFLPAIFSMKSLAKLLQEDYRTLIPTNQGVCREVELLKKETSNDYQRLILTYLRYYLPSLFIVEDKISMAHSLESRTPLCDNEMLNLALSIPLDKKLTNFELKHIPKTAMRNRLPSLIFNQPKRGFPTPLLYWFKKELRKYVQEFILDNFKYIDFFSRQKVEKIISHHCEQKYTTAFSEISAHKIWILINLIVYLKNQKHRYVR